MRDRYKSVLGDVKDLTKDLKYSAKEIDKINIREVDTSSELEEKR